MIRAALLCLLLQGCSYYAGIGVHPENLDDADLENPIFIGGGSMKCGPVRCFAEHHSGIFKTEEKGGYNLAGVKYHF